MSGFTDNYIKVQAPFEADRVNQIQAVQRMNILDNGHVEINLQEIPQMSWV